MTNSTTTTTTVHQRTAGIAAIAAPLLVLGSTLAYLANGEGMNDGELGGAIQVWGFIAYAIAIVGLCRLFEKERPGAAAAMTVVGLVGAASGVGYGVDSIQAALVSGESMQEMDSAAASLVLQLPGLVFFLGLIALGVLLLRTVVVARWNAIALIVGAVLFPMSRIPDAEGLAAAADAVLVVALVPIGLQLLRGRRAAAGATAAGAAAYAA